ncbi:MAG TPA: hypothetical protein VNO35_24430 [Steroidobacteraceae bacterium]|nr:hypothetical protein [Steroidobacteraceae bacterium]
MISLLRYAAVLSGVTLCWSLGYTQDIHPDIPTHSHAMATDQGWTCNDGFKQVAGFCVQDIQDPPAQSASEVFDGQWRCRAGYSRTNGICAPPTAPEHATLVGEGDRWECDWGFRRVAARCEEIIPPAHAYLDASGRDWLCFPGFERTADHCVRPPGDETNPGPAADAHEEAPAPTPN